MKTFANLCKAGFLQCFVPHVVYNEIASQGKAHQYHEISVISTAIKRLKKYNIPTAQYNILNDILTNLEDNRDSIINKPGIDFLDWCNSIKAIQIPLANHHASTVLDSYFLGSSPFKNIKTKDDFPDAFIYEVIKDLSVEPLLLVCDDDNLRKSCSTLPNVRTFKTVDQLLADDQIAPLILKIPKNTPEGEVKTVPTFATPTTKDWVEMGKRQLAAIGSRSSELRKELARSLINNLLKSEVQSALIASNDNKGEVLRVAIGDIFFYLEDASYYGEEKFSFAFEAMGALSLRYYVDEYSLNKIRGRTIKSERVYKDVEQFETDFSAHIFGRAILSADPASIEQGNILQNYQTLNVDEIQKIALSDGVEENNLTLETIKSQIIDFSIQQVKSIIKNTVSIWGARSTREHFGMIGSGFLLNFKGKNYLVTALHVHRAAAALGQIGVLRGDTNTIVLLKEIIKGRPPFISEDQDVWISEIEDLFSPENFLKHNPTTPLARAAITTSCSVGYPYSKNRNHANERLESVTYLNYIETSHLDENGFLFQNYAPGEIRDANGELVDAMRLNGMSGGPLLEFYANANSFKFPPGVEYAPASVAGVLIEYSLKTKQIKFANLQKILCDPFFN